MRRSLIVTVAAAVAMVLVAMLVPMGVLVRSYAMEDRLSRAALEVQATETVVSGQDPGAVNVYLDQINRGDDGTRTTVLYPPTNQHPDGLAIGPDPGEDARVTESRATGQARVDDAGDGAEILVPVSLGGSSPAAANTPVVRVVVEAPGLESGVLRAWLVLTALGLVLLGGALFLADRLGTSFVRPIRHLAARARRLGEDDARDPVRPDGPAEVRELTEAFNRLVGRVEVLRQREREVVADLSHRLRTPITALRLRVDGLDDPQTRARFGQDLDDLEALVDVVVRQARRSQREGVVASADGVAVLTRRVRFWEPLAQDQGREFTVTTTASGPVAIRASASDLDALVDVLLDNVFTHTPDDAAIDVTVAPRPGGGLVLTVDDAGPGFPAGVDVIGRGESGSGSTGLGLSIAEQTATESGGGLSLATSPRGGGRVVVDLGPAS